MKTLSIAVLALGLFAQDEFKTQWIRSYAKAADFIVKGQGDDGAWIREFRGQKFPSMALTTLIVDALVRMPSDLREKYKTPIDKGIAAIKKAQSEKDGSWAEGPGQLKAYVTALAVMALQAHDPQAHKDAVEKGQKYLVGAQNTEGFWEGSTRYGDPAKDPSKNTGDLSNTALAAEAMSESKYSDAEYWKRVVEFVGKCQNDSETNLDPEWLKMLEQKGYKVGNDGGFIYSPRIDGADESGAGVREENGAKTINSYGSMTYAGLKTYLYAGLEKNDPKVKAAIGWVRKNYSVERHPGFPFEAEAPAAKRKDNQGLYYYYMTMARALDAWGENPLVTDDGKKREWPKELAEKLISLQKGDGSWVNGQVRWWEGDPILCTPYILKVYAILARHLGQK